MRSANEGLNRVVGVSSLAANVVNNTIGGGIYALPAIVAIQMGAAGILGYLFCGAMLAAIVLCYVEVASRITTSGGSYAYVEAAFGPFAGFLINSIFFFGWGVIGDAAVLNILADSLSVLFPVFSNGIVRALLFFFLLGMMIWVNVRGVKQGVRFVVIITIIKLIPLVLIILFGFGHVSVSNLRWQKWPSITSLGDTAIVLFFAFAGFETALNMSGEIKNPKRTVPLGMLLAGVMLLIIYLLIQTITLGMLGPQISEFRSAPLAAVAEKIVGPIGATILLVATIISCLGNTSGDVLASPRLLFAAANDGLFPKYLAKVHPRFATPYWAVITYASLIFVFSVSGGFKQLAILASGALLLIYLAVVLAMIKFRLTKSFVQTDAFKIPGGLIIPVIAVICILWLLSHLSTNEVLSIAIYLSILSVIYFAMKLQKKKILSEKFDE